jgi:hypothetical protein
MMTMSWLERWLGTDDGNNVVAPVLDGSNVWFGLSLL